MPATADGVIVGAATIGQYCKHTAVHAECPGESRVYV
jgi:hypothetical protein